MIAQLVKELYLAAKNRRLTTVGVCKMIHNRWWRKSLRSAWDSMELGEPTEKVMYTFLCAQEGKLFDGRYAIRRVHTGGKRSGPRRWQFVVDDFANAGDGFLVRLRELMGESEMRESELVDLAISDEELCITVMQQYSMKTLEIPRGRMADYTRLLRNRAVAGYALVKSPYGKIHFVKRLDD